MAKKKEEKRAKITFGKRKKLKGKKLKAFHEARPKKSPLIGQKQKMKRS